MRLILEDEKTEAAVKLYLFGCEDSVDLMAVDSSGKRKCLITFRNRGKVYTHHNAEIGDFKFDKGGRLIIE